MHRIKTKQINVGNIPIGGNNKIVIQSMTNTKTKDVASTLKQINDLYDNGCEIVRVTCLDFDDAKAVKEIVKKAPCPIVADIHFDHRLALEAISSGVNKIRINPGNIPDKNNIIEIMDACRKNNVAIRIGVNTGSLPKDKIEKYGITVKAIIETIDDMVKLFESNKFKDIIISIKSSNINLFKEACEEYSRKYTYPLHIGITESGEGNEGIVKSVIGLSSVINQGIGDTMRVSLTGDPVQEIEICKEILKNHGLIDKPEIISCPSCGRTEYDMETIIAKVKKITKNYKKNLKIAVMGCIVNGPGEAKDSDIGISGNKDNVIVFKKGELVKNAPVKEGVEFFLDECKKMLED